MKVKTRQSGLSLMEEIVVVAIIALLVVFGLPAARSLYKSIEAEAGGKAMISAAFSAARAIAAKEQRYAGVRFQYAYYKDDPNKSPLKATQYMIFIVNDERKKMGNIDTGFRAVEGIKPIKLSDSVGVMDLLVNGSNPISDILLDTDKELIDATSFSIVFSPSGKLVIHDVRTRNRDGETATSSTLSDDDIFNRISQIKVGIGMFLQDDYFSGYSGSAPVPDLGLGPEPSRRSFIIYDRTIFEKVSPTKRYTDYLSGLKPIYINPYTGTMIEQ